MTDEPQRAAGLAPAGDTGATPQPGERWRVTLEGQLAAYPDEHGRVALMVDGNLSTAATVLLHPNCGTWERLPDPEPDYVIGAAYKSERDGLTYLRHAEGWVYVHFGRPGVCLFDVPLRPLRRLAAPANGPAT